MQFTVLETIITKKNIVCQIEYEKEICDILFSVELVKTSNPYLRFIYHQFKDFQYSSNERYRNFDDFLRNILLREPIKLPQTFNIELPF